ncbi:MAG TPA: lipoyl synthase [bacterium]|nr:lipoyl synthase [bacterium]HOL36010.1 lipoyl synthase [bacterium]
MNKFPEWVKKKILVDENYQETKSVIKKYSLHTVCTDARCPNIYECFSKKYATFMILGNVCTRACKFCSVNHNQMPQPVDPQEPQHIARAVKELGLKYIVITSVTRDDLADGGAKHFADCINEIRKTSLDTKIEPLIPDFKGNVESVEIVLEAKPDILAHNVETVPALYSRVRPQANYTISLKILEHAKKKGFLTKSAMMVGFGETRNEIIQVMKDLRSIDCDFFVIGQYLKPSYESIDVKEFVRPEVFEEYRVIGEQMGFKKVFAGVFCRSSYMAELALTE